MLSDSSLIGKINTLGKKVDRFPVELSTRFLQHFSEQLYSSPQKAFEELISNGWDAGATRVDVFIPKDLDHNSAALCVFDDGESMDDAGLKQLWRIADSPKSSMIENYGRPVIGKFGIGKLATYVLADRLTHICQGRDGKIRQVTMDYGSLRAKKTSDQDKLVSEMVVDLYEVSMDEVLSVIDDLPYGNKVKTLIEWKKTDKDIAYADGDDEFRTLPDSFKPPSSKSWTLVILSKIRPTGRSLKIGILRRMVSASLPMGARMAIRLNGQRVLSSKVDAEIMQSWDIGPELGISSLTIPSPDPDAPEEKIHVKCTDTPVTYVDIPGIGKVTGCVMLYSERLTGGKSEEHGPSNGFHVNVLGRIINQSDPAFGEKNLSHAAWARFRMAVRADGLNKYLITNREDFRKSDELRAFRTFLRAVFNKVRTVYDAKMEEEERDSADALLRALGPVSLQPLKSAVSEALQDESYLSSLIDSTDIEDKETALAEWRERTSSDLRKTLEKVEWEKRQSEDSISRYRVREGSLALNKQHPFVLEHRSSAEKQLIREVSLINFLTDLYAIDLGITHQQVIDIVAFRDRLLRVKAYQSRRGAPLVAHLLMEFQRDGNYKRLEKAVTAALRCLGFDVVELAVSGEPEGVAIAHPIPKRELDDNTRLYSFTYDAKSTKHEKAQTNNINHARLAEHRKAHKADYTLVIAPNFQGGKTVSLNQDNGVTPMRACDLAKLLETTASHGAIPFTKFREVFVLYDPDDVANWVDEVPQYLKSIRKLTLSDYLTTFRELKNRRSLQSISPSLLQDRLEGAGIDADQSDIIALNRGLQVLLPELISLENNNVRLSMSPEKIAEKIEEQLQEIRSSIH